MTATYHVEDMNLSSIDSIVEQIMERYDFELEGFTSICYDDPVLHALTEQAGVQKHAISYRLQLAIVAHLETMLSCECIQHEDSTP